VFAAIGSDPGNRVVILTGSGASFCADVDGSILAVAKEPGGWDRITAEGTAILENLLEVRVPMIGAVNGPATVHAELAVLCDIVIAQEDAYFQDRVHTTVGIVPGDGVHVIWPLLLGVNRGRYFLLTGQRIAADEARSLGIVGEVVPALELLPRARRLAAELACQPALTLRYARSLLTSRIKRELRAELAHGLALEGLALLERRRSVQR
jgi:enoyl-CoA hydratase/carnithine racemase